MGCEKMSDYGNNDERRYKIQKKISYEIEMSKEKKQFITSVFITAINGLMLVLNVYNIVPSTSSIDHTITEFMLYASTGMSISVVFSSLKKKAILEEKIGIIEEELKTLKKLY